MAESTVDRWSTYLASSYLSSLSIHASSPPSSSRLIPFSDDTKSLMALALRIPDSLPFHVIVNLGVILPPWSIPSGDSSSSLEEEQTEQAGLSREEDPLRGMFRRSRQAEGGVIDTDDLTEYLKEILDLYRIGGSEEVPRAAVLLFSLLRIGGSSTVDLLQSDSLPFSPQERFQTIFKALTETYGLLSDLNLSFRYLHILARLFPLSPSSTIPLPPIGAVIACLPTSTSTGELPKPFQSLWSDFETVFSVSGGLIGRTSDDGQEWSPTAFRLLETEGDKTEWETEALRREREQVSSPSASGSKSISNSRLALSAQIKASVVSVQQILPDLPSQFISTAMEDEYYGASTSSSMEEAIIQSVLEDTVPPHLRPLLDPTYVPPTVSDHTSSVLEEAETGAEDDPYLTMARQRRLQAESALGKTFDSLSLATPKEDFPALSSEIPDTMRSAILRLVETQREEQEEEEREERERKEARKEVLEKAKNKEKEAIDFEDEDGDTPGARVVGQKFGNDGEDSGEDRSEDEDSSNPTNVPLDIESLLEQTYMADTKVFDRDSNIRRGKPRAALKEQTGLSDEQIEGWKIMLERNPRKLASLNARLGLFAPTSKPPTRTAAQANTNQKGGGAKGDGSVSGNSSNTPRSNGGGSGRGGGNGNRGGSRGRGENKGSRGHSNQARKRGHDRKMARMGGPSGGGD
ncbi:hypothetical protein [Phaffia rhodozyma]|uniref:CUE domain-containing protein n=1 Tax=Phaffia rhodozyma TaxID=264483 RepID=A0A0F7SIT4_PHARH|nr:hypothetical protein [Phaffia rhodozyma]